MATGINIAIDPENLTDAQATEQGKFDYLFNGTYYGSNSPTTTGTGWSNIKTVYTPYKKQDGTWWLKGTCCGSTSGAASTLSLTISGIKAKNITSYRQAAYGYGTDNDSNIYGYIGPNNAVLVLKRSSGVNWTASFDIELDEIPDWAWR